jgi:hypothetical protein
MNKAIAAMKWERERIGPLFLALGLLTYPGGR